MKLTISLALLAAAVALATPAAPSATPAIDDKCSFECPDFYAVYEPVCGSDDSTYVNSCYLRRMACQSSNEITKVSDGFCPPKPDPASAASAINETMTDPSPEDCPDECADEACFGLMSNCQDFARKLSVSDPADCPDACPAVNDPVTDENGVEYSNKCYMRMAKCQDSSGNLDRKLKASDQDCPDACLDVDDPVIDENGEEYSNECYMKMAKCQKTNSNLDIERKLAVILS